MPLPKIAAGLFKLGAEVIDVAVDTVRGVTTRVGATYVAWRQPDAPVQAERAASLARTGINVFSDDRDIHPDAVVPVTSSAILYVRYDSGTKELGIKFNKKKNYPEYRYPGVPVLVFLGFINSPSKGGYFHRKVKQYSINRRF